MDEFIISAGIDIGTSTIKVIFSRLRIHTNNTFGVVPLVQVISKDIIYKSKLKFTPLLHNGDIDGIKVKEIIKQEYLKAGILPKEVNSGAIIITGESSRKRNSEEVVNALAEIAGDFVAVTAGPDLEAILAGKGSGAAKLSKEKQCVVCNLDIGGGTTNICRFKNGEIIDTTCLEIGGRVIKIKDKKVSYISDFMKKLLLEKKIALVKGDELSKEKAREVTRAMVAIMEEAVGLRKRSEILKTMTTTNLLSDKVKADIYIFSGGVADCINKKIAGDYKFNDIGIVLARALNNSLFKKFTIMNKCDDRARATVIGAGNYSIDISGSTIEYAYEALPIKNIPIIKLKLEAKKDIDNISQKIKKMISIYYSEKQLVDRIAFYMKGIPYPSFIEIETIANEIIKGIKEIINDQLILTVIVKEDIGKALGQALKRKIKNKVICIDNIDCKNGDYIDIGVPVAHGRAVPVIVKTLIFSNGGEINET